MHVVTGDRLAELDPGGAELTDLDLPAFRGRLLQERHSLKRTLTDARLFAGIGGAFADEILWKAKLSPTQMSTNLDDDEIAGLFTAAREVMDEWTSIRIEETGDGFPTKVTAFHPKMAVHGKHGEACPRCGAPIQRIVHGPRETNYCPGCQTGGKILADRALSRILKDDWPRTLEELEEA
jgi:formamidopyrimidine-DNA glycosylase